MELRQLERFLAVVDRGSLAAAGKALGLTQQALSLSLSNLEADLGVRLLNRSPGGLTRPTACGLALVRHARAQLAAAGRARDELLSLAAGRAGTVTLGVGEAFAGDLIALAVSRLRRELPDVRINLVEGQSEALRRRLYEGEFDFLAAGVSAYELEPGFSRELIYSTDDVIVVRRQHPLAGRRRLELADLVGHAWLVPYSRSADLGVIVETFLAENLPPPTRIIGSDAYRVGLQLLTTEDLLIMVSPALVGPELVRRPAALCRLPIDRPTVRRHASLIWSEERPLSPQGQRLLEEVRRVARERHPRPTGPVAG